MESSPAIAPPQIIWPLARSHAPSGELQHVGWALDRLVPSSRSLASPDSSGAPLTATAVFSGWRSYFLRTPLPPAPNVFNGAVCFRASRFATDFTKMFAGCSQRGAIRRAPLQLMRPFGPSLAGAAARATSPMRRNRFRVAAARATSVLDWRSDDWFAPARHGLVGHLPKFGL